MAYKLKETGVLRLSDGASIPEAPDNRDWQEYQAWLEAGNTPLPMDEPTLEQVRNEAIAQINALDNESAIGGDLIPGTDIMTVRYTTNTLEVLKWIEQKRPVEHIVGGGSVLNPDDFPAADLEAAGYRATSDPTMTISKMLELWEVKWRSMAEGDSYRKTRREYLERLKAAQTVEEIQAIMDELK